MTRHTAFTLAAVAALLSSPIAARQAAQAPNQPVGASSPVEVRDGTASFDADTNIGAISVHGKSTGVRGRAVVRQAGEAIVLEQVQAVLPVKSISTGMGLRDEHMRKYVFTTTDGQVPDVTFTSERSQCAGGGADSTCQVSGNLAIRGTPRPFAIALKVQKAGDGYKAKGDGIVKLSAYGIERPSQLGVKTADEVKLHLEFTAKPAASAAADLGAPR
jgi:polyisoprenoid-binding protein YceI